MSPYSHKALRSANPTFSWHDHRYLAIRGFAFGLTHAPHPVELAPATPTVRETRAPHHVHRIVSGSADQPIAAPPKDRRDRR
eukprot:1188752-Prorocentrum_minimum.AAC.1